MALHRSFGIVPNPMENSFSIDKTLQKGNLPRVDILVVVPKMMSHDNRGPKYTSSYMFTFTHG